ncbi:MAG: MFS transporter, partial [Pseudomonadales bacterium]
MFFGWYIVAGSFFAQLLVIGFFTYSVSLLVSPIQLEFGVGLEEVMYSLTLGTLFGLVAMPAGGILIDRVSTRWVMSAGAVIFALAMFGISRAENITQYCVMFGLSMSLANAMCGSQSASTTIARWFSASRGRALGISALGTSVGGVAIPLLLASWIESYGWRTALEYFSYVIAILLIPVLILTIRGTPAEAGLLMEGAESEDASGLSPPVGLTTKQIVSKPAYWLIGIPLGLLFSTYVSILSNITPYATGLNATVEQAGQLITAIAVCGFIGKLIFGFAADKISLKLGLWLALALVFIGFMILSLQPSYPGMLLAACSLGLAAGGQLPVWGAMMAKA